MTLDKDLNVPPYYDDYDEDDNYHRIVYRPTMAVQARELTQQQTMTQNQIERFGNHVFKDGSVVMGVGITYYPNTHYVSLSDTFNSNSTLFPTDIDSTYLITNSIDSNTAVRAVVKIAKDGIEASYPDTNRMYFDYLTAGQTVGGAEIQRFIEGDTLYVYNENQVRLSALDANNLVDSIETLTSNAGFTATGNAYCIGTSDGIIFQKGFFIQVDPHVITVRDYTNDVDKWVVGFDVVETIVNEIADPTLLDNALGYENENAPGAHRLKLTPQLVSKVRTDTSLYTGFFSIVEFDSDQPVEQNDGPQYNALNAQMARRTYEESGDYVVNPFTAEARANTANGQMFVYEVSSGSGFVRGNRVEKLGTSRLSVPRATTVDYAQNQTFSANFGNYVKVNEFLGAFDTEVFEPVDLYDTAQNTISEYEGISSAPSGSSIGTAFIRATEYNSGTKGQPDAEYYLYLFNITMNSGESFADVRSIYSNGATFGKAKADIILEGGKAVLSQSSSRDAIFDTGMKAVKTLTGNTGIGDTIYNYTQIKSGTILGAGGTTAITIDTAGPGVSEEKLTSGVATLTGSSIGQYNVYLSANAYTANLTGTIAYTSGNSTVTGSGTAFTSELEVGDNIRIISDTNIIRRVTSIASGTELTMSAAITQSNSGVNVGQYFVGGTPMPLADINITSNTAFTANANMTLDSGNQTVYVQYPVTRNQAQAIPKLINKNIYVKLDCSNNAANSVGPWDLGLTDTHKIRNVYVGTTYANTNPDRVDWFDLDNGQRPGFYDHGKLVVKSQYASQISASTKMLVVVDFFESNTAASVGFYSVESYPVDDDDTANTDAIQTIELPVYNEQSVRDMIDFRPPKYSTGNTLAVAEGGATINPAASNSSFDIPAGGQYQIAVRSNFIADYEYYLPRRDLITIDPEGTFIVNQGVPSIIPKTPFVENDQSAVISAYVPPYPSATKREYDANRPTLIDQGFIRTNIETNRRYTMKDIGGLEQRIKRVEYYTVLNVLEQQARDLTIPDTSGLNRFKNGIFADPFNSHLTGNVQDFEYKIAIDPIATVARPFFNSHGLDLAFDSANSTNVQRTGPVITLAYTNEAYIVQRFATKIRNTTESVWQWNGFTELYPSFDFFRDITVVPNVQVDLDLAAPWEQFAQTPFAADFGNWRTTSRTSRQQIHAQTLASTTTTTTQQQIIQELAVGVSQQNIDLGPSVRDVTLQPYLRSRLISFVSYSMKPNTTLHAFFDEVNIDEHCAPGILSGAADIEEGHEDRIVAQSGVFGANLVSDSTGFVCGVFRIPAETFRTGDREFLLSNVDDLVVGADAQITRSTATFTGDNLAVTRSSTTINIRQPEISTATTVNNRTNVRQQFFRIDPIAQSFKIESLPLGISGAFVPAIGVYFQSKDDNVGCNLYVVEMENNVPNMNRILSKSFLPSSSINVSADATLETVFTLNHPVYLLSPQDYAFVVMPVGSSPEYNIWVGETGGFDITSNEQVFSNPYDGLMFISANQKTWTAIQKEDLKFNIYRSKFDPLAGTAYFNNDDDEYLTVDGFNRVNTDLGIAVGDLVYTVNSSHTPGDTTSIASNTLSTLVYGRIQSIDEGVGTVWLDSSTANNTSWFSNSINQTIAVYRSSDEANTDLLIEANLIAYANIATVDDLEYHLTVPKFGIIQPAQASMSFSYKGTTTSDVIDNSFYLMDNNNEFEYVDSPRHLKSKSNEIIDLASGKSSQFKIDMASSSEYVSPVVNLSQKGSLFIENLINNDANNEHTRYGEALTKYVSKNLILADGQEAEDLSVFLTAYRPSDSDIKVYAKFWNDEDPEIFTDKVWTELAYKDNGDTVYSSADKTNFIEYEFYVPSTNAVDYGAFSNTNVGTDGALTGTIAVVNNSFEVVGTGTAFDTEVTVGDELRIVAGSYTALRTVVSIANSEHLTVDNGLQAANTAALYYVYTAPGNDGIVEYQNTVGSRFIGYKELALKIVLLSSNKVRVPLLNDVRAICLQV